MEWAGEIKDKMPSILEVKDLVERVIDVKLILKDECFIFIKFSSMSIKLAQEKLSSSSMMI